MRNTIAVLAASVTIALAGCGDDTASAPQALQVPLDGYRFPDDLRVASSGQITFTSVDAEPHKIEVDGAGQTASFGAGEEATLPAPDDGRHLRHGVPPAPHDDRHPRRRRRTVTTSVGVAGG